MATKIFKNQGLSFVFAQKNAACCISGKTNEMYNLLLGELAPSTRQVADRQEILNEI